MRFEFLTRGEDVDVNFLGSSAEDGDYVSPKSW